MTILQHSIAQAAAAATGYQISRSLRFNSADSAYLNRTPASAGNRKTWTWSGWVKRSALSVQATLFSAGIVDYFQQIVFDSATNGIDFIYYNATVSGRLITTPVYRDTSAWYHIVAVWDTSNATSGDRMRLYVNGTRITALSTATYPSQNTDGYINNNQSHAIGRTEGYNSNYQSGYLADIYFIDGQALDPTSFGQTDSATGVWSPIAYTGTYGTNGFYVNFSDNSGTTSTTLGKDSSGNGNNWTPNNFSVTAGVGNDSLVDSPTWYGTDTGAGGEVRGNYCTLNPLDAGSNLTFADGNLQISSSANPNNNCRGTLGVASGKWYWEVTPTAGAGGTVIGIASDTASVTSNFSGDIYAYDSNGNKQIGATGSAYGATYGTNDVIGIAFDADNRTITFYKNNTSQGTISSITSGLTWRPFVHANSKTVVANFGQRPFASSAPSGFKALVTANLP